MPAEPVADKLRLRHPHARATGVTSGLLPRGISLECDLREIDHPEGRFRHADGTRYDICVMDVQTQNFRPPAVSRENFVGDGADNRLAVIRLGNVQQTSFRLCLISPGAAFGTLAAAAKPAPPT